MPGFDECFFPPVRDLIIPDFTALNAIEKVEDDNVNVDLIVEMVSDDDTTILNTHVDLIVEMVPDDDTTILNTI